MEKETKKTTKLLNPVTTLAAGLALGAVSRLLDIFTQNPVSYTHLTLPTT